MKQRSGQLTKLLVSRIACGMSLLNGITLKQPLNGVPGVSFEMARDVFRDIFAIEWVDERQGRHEERFAAVGMVENRLLFVAYTMRGDRIRIISARKAEPYERRRYHDESTKA